MNNCLRYMKSEKILKMRRTRRKKNLNLKGRIRV